MTHPFRETRRHGPFAFTALMIWTTFWPIPCPLGHSRPESVPNKYIYITRDVHGGEDQGSHILYHRVHGWCCADETLLFETRCCTTIGTHSHPPYVCSGPRFPSTRGVEGCHGRYGTVCDILLM